MPETTRAVLDGRDNLRHDLPRRFTHLTLPACLWWTKPNWLSLEAKVVLAEIDQLCTEKRHGHRLRWCWADNPHFERLIEREERTVRRVLEELKERGLIVVDVEPDPSRANHQKRWIALNGRDLSEALACARGREAAREEGAGNVGGQDCPRSAVNSDRRPLPDRRSELTADPACSLESEKVPCKAEQQQAAFHERLPAKAAAKTAAAASLYKEPGDGISDAEAAASGPNAKAAPVGASALADDFRVHLLRGDPIGREQVEAALKALGMEPDVGAGLLEAHPPAVVAYWIARAGDKERPCGFIRRMVQDGAVRDPLLLQPDRGRQGRAPQKPLPAAAKSPPLRIAPYRPPGREAPSTQAQLAAEYQRLVDDPELTAWARQTLMERIARLSAGPQAAHAGGSP